MANDLIAGAWRNGVDNTTLAFVNEEMERRRAGFRLLPLSSTVVDLADLLDSYDDLVADLLENETVLQGAPLPKNPFFKEMDNGGATPV